MLFINFGSWENRSPLQENYNENISAAWNHNCLWSNKIYDRTDNRNKIKLGQWRKSLGNSKENKDEVTINATAKRN